MTTLNDIKSNESGRHFMAKTLLFDWLTDGDCIFVFDNGHHLEFKLNIWDFASIESHIFNGYLDVPYKNLTSCYSDCIGMSCEYILDETGEILIDEIDEDYRIFNRKDLNKNTLIFEENRQAYKVHPCNFCSHKDVAKVNFIFDIAFGYKGYYNYAIEIVYKSPVKQSKINFCKRNRIELIIIDYKDILSSKLPPRHFKAKLISHY